MEPPFDMLASSPRSAPAMPDLVFCSPDRARAQSVITRLRNVAKVTWEAAASPEKLAARDGSLLLLDFSGDTARASSELARELLRLSPNTVLLGMGNTQGSTASGGLLAAMRAGVRDFLDIDADADEARAVITRAMKQRAPANLMPVARFQGKTVLLLGARAGVGTSTLAAHLASIIQQQCNAAGDKQSDADHVLLLDLGQPGGDAALYVDVRGEFQVRDAIDNAHRFDATLARTALPRHENQLAVLSQSVDSETPDGSSDADLGLLVGRLRGFFELVLIDLGGVSSWRLSPPLIRSADEIWLVVDQGVASMVSLDDLLAALRRCGADRARMQLLVNRYDEESGLDPQQIAERFKLPLLATLPERSRALRGNANLGHLLHETAPRDRYVRALQPLLERLVPGMPGTGPRNSRLRQMFGR